MKLTVKIFLWLNMIVAAAVVTMGVFIFKDREIIKARTVLLEQNANRIAQNLNWGGAVDWETPNQRKSAPFAIPATVNSEEITALDGSLKELSGMAQLRGEQLTTRWGELVETKQVLATTQENLRVRESELADTRTRLGNLERELAGVQNELRESNRTVDTLRSEKSALERNLADLGSQMESLTSQSATLAGLITKRTGELDRASELLAACLDRDPNKGPGSNRWSDVPATILAVDPVWNIAVIDKGEVDTLPMFMEAFIHRGDKFIGKIRVMRVENTVAIAEILTETLVDGAQVVAGDTVFFQ